MEFGRFFRLRQEQSSKPTSPARQPPLLDPMRVGATMKPGEVPVDFSQYRYIGPMLETIETRKGKIRCVVAQMVLQHHSSDEGGGHSALRMTASADDLKRADHPQAQGVAKLLKEYYDTKIVPSASAQNMSAEKRNISAKTVTMAPTKSTPRSLALHA